MAFTKRQVEFNFRVIHIQGCYIGKTLANHEQLPVLLWLFDSQVNNKEPSE
jgi:hypothetical protein